MSDKQMMAACPKYDADDGCQDCPCGIVHEYEKRRCPAVNGERCPACTPLPAAEQPAACRWTQDANDCWETSCGHAYSINDGTPVQNGLKFCAFCGKAIEPVVFSEEEEDMEDEDASETPPRKTPRERIEEEIGEKDLPSLGWNTYPMYAALRVIAAADAREDALREEVAQVNHLYMQALTRLGGMEDLRAQLATANKDLARREPIVDRCPSCNGKTLFVGSGGYLTCSRLDCAEPGVGRAVANLTTQLAAAKEEVERLNAEFANYTDTSDATIDRLIAEKDAAEQERDAITKTCDEVAKLHEAAEREVERLREAADVLVKGGGAPCFDACKTLNHEVARAEAAEKETERLRIDRDAMRIERDEMRELCSEYEQEIERLTADKAALDADHDWERERRRERLDWMVAALVGIHNDVGDQCYDFKTAVADGAKILAAIDAHMAQREEGK